MISYRPLMITLATKGKNKTDLMNLTGISSATISRLAKGDYLSLSVIEKICQALNCRIENVVEILPDEK